MRLYRRQPGLHGLCILHSNRALIRITLDAEAVMVESLIEEWCHVLREETPVRCDDDHDAIFWAIYGAVSLRWRGEK